MVAFEPGARRRLFHRAQGRDRTRLRLTPSATTDRRDGSRGAIVAPPLAVVEQRSPALRAAAPAGVPGALPLGQPTFDIEPVVVAQLLAVANRPLRLDEDAALGVLDRHAVRIAGMIDPPRRIAADAGVDHAAVVELEQERVRGILRIAV